MIPISANEDNPLFWAESIVDDEDRSFVEVYFIERLEEDWREALASLSACVSDWCPQCVLVAGCSNLDEEEVFEAIKWLASRGVQFCFYEDYEAWKVEAL